jgi:LPXTG-motif cell wall-anchored protein
MNKLRVAIFMALILALIVPFTAQAATYVYYCSTLRSGGGSGSYADPWGCANADQFNYVVNDVICPAGGGWLYQVYDGYYTYHRIEWVNRQCSITWTQQYRGYPPNTGVTLPMPLLVGLVGAAGVVLIVGGLVLRRRKMA